MKNKELYNTIMSEVSGIIKRRLNERSDDLIYGSYFVADCEHYGDVERAERYLKNLGCSVQDNNYSSSACRYNDVYIEFSFNKKNFNRIYNELCDAATFSDDINKYIGNGSEYLSTKDFRNLCNKWKNDETFESGFENMIPVECFFQCYPETQEREDEIIEDIIDILGNSALIVAKNKRISDGNLFVSLLITMYYKDVRNCYDVKDYALGSDGYFKDNRIYGECRCISPLMPKRFIFDTTKYDILEQNVEYML